MPSILIPEKTERCAMCRKKAMILTSCKCCLEQCLKCRAPEDHKCTFDFQKEARMELTLSNPKIEAKKIDQI